MYIENAWTPVIAVVTSQCVANGIKCSKEKESTLQKEKEKS